jgi:hypothetical protein
MNISGQSQHWHVITKHANRHNKAFHRSRFTRFKERSSTVGPVNAVVMPTHPQTNQDDTASSIRAGHQNLVVFFADHDEPVHRIRHTSKRTHKSVLSHDPRNYRTTHRSRLARIVRTDSSEVRYNSLCPAMLPDTTDKAA